MPGYIGMLGPSKVHMVLGELLEKLNDPKVTTFLTKHFFAFKQRCQFIEVGIDASCKLIDEKSLLCDKAKKELKRRARADAEELLKLSRAAILDLALANPRIPKKLFDYWRNCITIQYRTTLTVIKSNK